LLLVVGLGNPGREHEGQRHNVGFVVTGELRQRWGLPDFRARFSGQLTRGEARFESGARPVALLQPQTYMNLSGDCVKPAAAFLGASVGDILVVHDELDLPFGDVRIKVGGGHAGHNGLRSLIQRLGSADFLRVRIGIGRPPPGDAGRGMDVAGWVLSKFDPLERAELPSVVIRATDAVERILRDGPDAAMLAVHTRAPSTASTASTKR
jgi:PTH1 family peptidyl-tRNA hydrolase